jgi:hypothetical protein
MKARDAGDTIELGLHFDLGPGVDRGELDKLTSELRRKLLDLKVESVEPLREAHTPAGTRGMGLAEAGGLVVKLGKEGLAKVVEVVRAWLAIDAKRSAKLVIGDSTIELSGLTVDQQQQLVDAWIKQVLTGQPPRKRKGKRNA